MRRLCEAVGEDCGCDQQEADSLVAAEEMALGCAARLALLLCTQAFESVVHAPANPTIGSIAEVGSG